MRERDQRECGRMKGEKGTSFCLVRMREQKGKRRRRKEEEGGREEGRGGREEEGWRESLNRRYENLFCMQDDWKEIGDGTIGD